MKSYNPFKMAGAWIGATIGGIYAVFFQASGQGLCGDTGCPGETIIAHLQTGGTLGNYGFIVNGYMQIGIMVIIAFLLGWGIHSMIRKYK